VGRVGLRDVAKEFLTIMLVVSARELCWR